MTRSFCLTLLLTLLCAPAWSLNIVLTNDDGFETANIQTLYRLLSAAGHDVILSAPYSGQSGSGGKIAFLQPIGPTAAKSPEGSLPAGSPGVGATGLGPQQFYVDGSPAAALLYGIDVQAQRIWGRFPDLVIAGPNEGNNLGIVTPHSGTLGATVTALNKGIPAIAVSADNGDAEQAKVVAELMLKLLGTLSHKEGVDLPAGVGLNVNMPPIDTTRSKAADFQYLYTQIGTSSNIGLRFVEDLGADAFARRVGVPADLNLPGVVVAVPPSAAGYPEDSASNSESGALKPHTVTVSPIQGTYAADRQVADRLRQNLRGLIAD
ncbi:MAG: 5'/3'-nucleotidase SurE [Pseudomonadales bacterium]